MSIDLSLVIPVYNEEDIIQDTLNNVLNYLSTLQCGWELIIVDDGSTDKTRKLIGKYTRKVKLIKMKENRGKGAALREGILGASGEYILFSDADLSVPLDTVEEVFKGLRNGADVVIGTRRAKNSKILVHQPLLRENMGRIYTAMSRVITGVNVTDFTCGFKGFKKDVAKKIFSRTRIDRWAYDSEVLFLANKYGYKIKEVPVFWKNRKETKVRLGGAIFSSLRDLLRVRLNDISRRYGE